MLPKPLAQIEQADIQRLIADQAVEHQQLDFKRQVPGATGEDKRELCADITSFANSTGGDLVFGVQEADGHADAITPVVTENIDREIQRLEAIVHTGTEPRVPGLHSRAIPVPGGHVIVMRVLKSWIGPHLVKVNDGYK